MTDWSPAGDFVRGQKWTAYARILQRDVLETPLGEFVAKRNPAGRVSVVAANVARVLPLDTDSMRRDHALRSQFGRVTDNQYLTACREYALLTSAAHRLTFLSLTSPTSEMLDASYRAAFQSRLIRLANPGLPSIEVVDARHDHYLGVFHTAHEAGEQHVWAWLAYSYLRGIGQDLPNIADLTDVFTLKVMSAAATVAQLLRSEGFGPANLP